MAKRTTPTHRKASASRSRATGEVPVPAHAPGAVEKIGARKQGDGGSFRAGLGDHAALQVFRALLEAATGRGGNYEHLRSAVAQARDRFPVGDPRRSAPLPGAPPTGEYDGRNDHARGVAVGLLDGLVTWEEAVEALAWPATGAPDPMRRLRIAGHLNARWRAVRALAQVVQAAPWLGRALAPTVYAAPWMHRLREEDARACAEQARLHSREAMRALAALACLEREFGNRWDGATWETLRALLEAPELARYTGPLRAALTPGPDAPPPPVMVRELEAGASAGGGHMLLDEPEARLLRYLAGRATRPTHGLMTEDLSMGKSTLQKGLKKLVSLGLLVAPSGRAGGEPYVLTPEGLTTAKRLGARVPDQY